MAVKNITQLYSLFWQLFMENYVSLVEVMVVVKYFKISVGSLKCLQMEYFFL